MGHRPGLSVPTMPSAASRPAAADGGSMSQPIKPELGRETLADICEAIFDVTPDTPLFDNVPSDMTWGQLIQEIVDRLP